MCFIPVSMNNALFLSFWMVSRSFSSGGRAYGRSIDEWASVVVESYCASEWENIRERSAVGLQFAFTNTFCDRNRGVTTTRGGPYYYRESKGVFSLKKNPASWIYEEVRSAVGKDGDDQHQCHNLKVSTRCQIGRRKGI